MRNAKLILINGNLITLDHQNPKATWVAIQEGKLINLGNGNSWKDFRSGGPEIIDCKGKTVLPGFIDAHLHIYSFAESLMSLDLRPTNNIRSISDIQSKVHTLAKELRPSTWIKGKGYNEFHLHEKRHPNRWDLDIVARNHPVIITHRSGHAHVLNSMALKLVNINHETGDPPGGMIERELKTGEPTGLLYEMGGFLFERIPPINQKELEKGVRLANQTLVSKGITSIQDASSHNDMGRWKLLNAWKESAKLQPRVNMMLGFRSFKEKEVNHFHSYSDANYIKTPGVKIILDETTGRLFPAQVDLNQMVLDVHEAGLQIAIHAIEESAIEASCNSIAFALDRIPRKKHRHRIEHCSLCSPSLAKKIASLGIAVVTQPSFIFFNGERYLKTISNQKLKHLYPLKTLIQEGIIVAGSSDCPIVPVDPLIGISSAISRRSQTQDVIVPEEGISRIDALQLFTKNAAFVTFEEESKGTISPGKLADLVILSGDPTRLPPGEIKELEVEMTIIGGKAVWNKMG